MIGRYLRNLVLWVILLSLVVYFFLATSRPRTLVEEISYSQILLQARSGRIAQVTIRDTTVTGRLRDGQAFQMYVPSYDTSYLDTLQTTGVQIVVEPTSRSTSLPDLLSTILPFLLLGGLWMLMTVQARRECIFIARFGGILLRSCKCVH